MHNTIVHVKTKKDQEGNKRELFILYGFNQPIEAWKSYADAPEEYRQMILDSSNYTIHLAPSEYKRLKKVYVK